MWRFLRHRFCVLGETTHTRPVNANFNPLSRRVPKWNMSKVDLWNLHNYSLSLTVGGPKATHAATLSGQSDPLILPRGCGTRKRGTETLWTNVCPQDILWLVMEMISCSAVIAHNNRTTLWTGYAAIKLPAECIHIDNLLELNYVEPTVHQQNPFKTWQMGLLFKYEL